MELGYPVWIQIVVALLAVFGVYSILRMLADIVFAAKCIGVAVHVRTESEVMLLEGALREATGMGRGYGRQPVTVLFYPEVACFAFDVDDEPKVQIAELLFRYRANYCLMK